MLQGATFYVVWRLWRNSFRTGWNIAVELVQAFASLVLGKDCQHPRPASLTCRQQQQYATDSGVGYA